MSRGVERVTNAEEGVNEFRANFGQCFIGHRETVTIVVVGAAALGQHGKPRTLGQLLGGVGQQRGVFAGGYWGRWRGLARSRVMVVVLEEGRVYW